MVIVQAENVKAELFVPVLPAELRLRSARCLRFVAPSRVEMSDTLTEPTMHKRKLSGTDEEHDAWEGVSEMCQALDDCMEIDRDTELLADRSVLELGFSTGIPSALALDSGAADVTVHAWEKEPLEYYIRPTMQRNNAPQSRVKYSHAGVASTLKTLRGKRFDVILAPELLRADEADFGALHDLLDALLKPDGIVLLCSRSYYTNCSGSLQAFLDLAKMRNKFDAHCRWTSDVGFDPAPRKLIQLTRATR